MISAAQTQPRRSRLFPDRNKPRPWWVPGRVEIKFREHVRPRLAERRTQDDAFLESQNGVDLSAFHRILLSHRASKVVPVFSLTHEEADEWQRCAREKGHATQHLGHFLTVHLDSGADVHTVARALRTLPEIESASPVPRLQPASLPNDPLLGNSDKVEFLPGPGPDPLQTQWYIFRCKADQAWTIATGKNVAIAVIDQGFNPNHEDLKPNVDVTYSPRSKQLAIDNDRLRPGDIRHGTAAAGMVAAASNNGVGVAGFAYNSRLWLVQAQPDIVKKNGKDEPELQTQTAADAISWVTGKSQPGISRRVLAIPLVSPSINPQSAADATMDIADSVRAAIDLAIANGIVVCLPAGNDPTSIGRDVAMDSLGTPFTHSDAIIVAATKYVESGDNPRLPQSNWGPGVTVSAPGDPKCDVACSSESSGYFTFFALTSSACPKVAGTAALMLEVNPQLTHAEVKAILNGSGTYQDPDDFSKPVGPFLNALAAVQQASSPPGPHLVANRFLNFGAIKRGTTSPTQVLQVFNIGNSPAHLTSLTLKDGSAEFTILPSSPFPITLANDHKPATFQASFSPVSTSDSTATFLLSSDDPSSPMEIKCTGTAPWNLDSYLRLFAWVLGGLGIVALIVLLLILTHVIRL